MTRMLGQTDREDVETLTSLDEIETIVDSDTHVRENLDLLLPYIDDEYQAAREMMRQASRPSQQIIQSTSPTPPTLSEERRYHTLAEEGKIGEDGGRVEEGGIDPNDATDRIKLQRAFGIDHSVVVAGGLLLALPTVTNDQLAVALANGYNNWLLDTFLDESDDALKGALQVAAQRPDIAAEEIDRRSDEKDIVGVQVLASGHVPPLSDTRYDPIYQAAQDNDLPVMFHSATPAISRGFPMQHRWHEIYVEDKVISHAFSHMWNLTKMLYQGLPVRFPDLDFVFQEAGIAWIPYMTWRLDDYYLQFTDQIPMLEKLPSEYVRDRFYFSTQPLGHTARNPDHMAYAVEMAGPDSLMFASDIPHGDFDTPDELFDRVRGHFDAETVTAMMGTTATELFGL